MSQKYGVLVRFIVKAEDADEAEALIDALCEKAAASSGEGDISYEGVDDLDEEEEDEEE